MNLVNIAMDRARSAPYGTAAGAQGQRRHTWRLDHDSLIRQLDRVSASLHAGRTAIYAG